MTLAAVVWHRRDRQPFQTMAVAATLPPPLPLAVTLLHNDTSPTNSKDTGMISSSGKVWDESMQFRLRYF